MINISQLKEFAKELPPSSLFRELVLAEPDIIPAPEFVDKSVVWVRLFARESRKS
jgi:hypothetical protein